MWTSLNRRRCAWTLASLFFLSVMVLSCSKLGFVPNASVPVKMEPGAQVVAAQYNVGGYMFRYPPAPGMKEQHTEEEIRTLNANCVACHSQSDGDTMHNGKLSNQNATVIKLSCADCHGGNINVEVPAGIKKGDAGFERYKVMAHVAKMRPDIWPKNSAANPEITAALTLAESVDYIRFVNPGDLRAAQAACGACHNTEEEGHIVDKVNKSMMTNGQMLWQAALYNNGAINRKTAVYAESYAPDGRARKIQPTTAPTQEQIDKKGMAVALWPLPRWEISQPGNVLRVFERGGKHRPIIGEGDPFEDAGKPDVKLSIRGPRPGPSDSHTGSLPQ